MNREQPAEPLITSLERLAEIDDRGALSALRRSLSEDAPAQAYPYVVPFFPREPSDWLERTYLLIAGLFALHPTRGSSSLAAALRRVRVVTGSPSIEQRFVALLDAHREDLGPHLRHAVALVRSHEIAIDWHDLLRTARYWNESARRSWARDFWGGASPDEGEKKSAFPKEVADELIPLFKDAAKAPDLALFGRMIADNPSWNVDAACQVAHAISTNRVAMDFDFYTAVDDLRPEDTAGSDMMGTVQFNSSCFYRYSVLDVDDLRRNLSADDDLLRKTVGAYIRASFLAIPTGKQNSMAAHNPPSFMLAIPRQNGTPISLANAFCKPVRPNGDSDLVDASIEALQDYLQRVLKMCGVRQAKAFYVADRKITPLNEPIQIQVQNDLCGLVGAVVNQIVGTPQ